MATRVAMQPSVDELKSQCANLRDLYLDSEWQRTEALRLLRAVLLNQPGARMLAQITVARYVGWERP